MIHIEGIDISRTEDYAFFTLWGLRPGVSGVGEFEVFNKMYRGVKQPHTATDKTFTYAVSYFRYLRYRK